MDIFQRASVVRLRSHHDKYLLAENDQEGVCQERIGSFKNAKWTVEIIEEKNLIRLKSCYGKYLTASNMPFLLGATGKKVFQTLPTRLNSSLEWEPIREGNHVRLKTPYGQFLRANGGLPPWRNSVTHDIPHRTKFTSWVLWDVDLVELRPQQLPKQIQEEPVAPNPTLNICTNGSASLVRSRSPSPSPSPSPPGSPTVLDSFGIDLMSPIQHKRQGSEDSGSPMKKGRMIYYNVGDENGDVPKGSKEKFFAFKGSSVKELKEKLKEETGLDDILVCCRNPLNAKLYPLRLQLPPNNTDVHIVVIPSSQA